MADGAISLKRLEMAGKDELAAAYRHCASVVKNAAGNFYYAFLLLPKAKRSGINALYAFCRAGDDAADDESGDRDPHLALDRLKRCLDECYEGYYSDLQTLALADSIRRFQFDRADFNELLVGVESDLDYNQFQTVEDQDLYCYRVASTVGLLCLKIFGADDDLDREFANHLGKGMQITNILRDLKEDAERGRLYIPLDDLDEAGVESEHLFKPTSHDNLIAVVRMNIKRARDHFAAARKAMVAEHSGKLIAARAMGMIYETILNRIESNPGSLQRVELSRMEKLGIIRRLLEGSA